ncbi:Fic family protein [Actinomycetota bacterium]
MGTYVSRSWQSDLTSGLPRRARRSGEYRAHVPDPLAGSPLALQSETDAAVAEAERMVRSVDGSARDLAGIARFLLRSEAIASSRIEGITPSARQVALAELGQSEDVKGVSEQAQQVAHNMTIVREATTELLDVGRIDVAHIVRLHASLLPDESKHHGIRTAQNWVGGSDWHPLEADYVPPPPGEVPRLMADLTDYLATGLHSPLVQAALVHAQFETIHPFTDGNGRVGRALIHTVLGRRGLTREAVLPISLVLATLKTDYIGGLTAYRTADPAISDLGMQARDQWIAVFARATSLACQQATRIAGELAEIRSDWEERLLAHRSARGARRALRSDSATAAILADLPATPILTPQTAHRIHDVSRPAAAKALDELHAAGILEKRSIGPGRQAYAASDVLEMITWAERRLASTRFDTRVSPPQRGVPAAPQGEQGADLLP